MSPPSSSRFTAWLSGPERELLRELAGELGTSENYVVRTAVRLLLGLSVSPWARERAEELLDSPPATGREVELARRELA